ncbi:MAG: helix-turn-helix domain-containing protein [Thermoplasmata archaeon]
MPRGRGTRDRILDAALEVFAEKGFTGATTKEIARRARVNEVTVFRLFKTKKALFGATMLERSALGQVRKSVSNDLLLPLEELMARNMKAVLSVLRSNKHFFAIMLADGWRNPRTKAILNEMGVQRGLDFVTSMMAQLMEAGKIRRVDPRIPARMMMGALQSYFLMTDLLEGIRASPTEEERTIRGFADIFANGMKPSAGAEENDRT